MARQKIFFFQVWAGFERPVCNAYYAYYALLCWLLLIVWRGTICMVKATNRETNSRWLDSGKSILKIRVLFSWLIIPGQSKSGRARLGLFCTELKVGLTSNIISNPSFTLVSTKFDFLHQITLCCWWQPSQQTTRPPPQRTTTSSTRTWLTPLLPSVKTEAIFSASSAKEGLRPGSASQQSRITA